MSKNKYYAIKEGKGVKNKIVRSWEECKKYVHGYSAVYKSFKTQEECNEYFKTVNPEKIKEQTKYQMEKKKKLKNTTKSINLRISNEMYKDLEDMCKLKGIKMDHAIKFALNQYLY